MMISLFYRYAVGRFDRDSNSFTIDSYHLFYYQARNAFIRKQGHDLDVAFDGGHDWSEWAIMSLKTGNIVPLSSMVKTGWATITRR